MEGTLNENLHSFNNEEWNANPLTSSATFKNLQLAKLIWRHLFSQCILNSRFGFLVYFWLVSLYMAPSAEDVNPQAGFVPQKENLHPDSLSSGQVLQHHCLTEMPSFALWALDPQCLTTFCLSPICEMRDPLDKDRDKVRMEQQAMCTEQSRCPQ